MESSAAGMGRSLVHGRVSSLSPDSFPPLILGETAVHESWEARRGRLSGGGRSRGPGGCGQGEAVNNGFPVTGSRQRLDYFAPSTNSPDFVQGFNRVRAWLFVWSLGNEALPVQSGAGNADGL